ncbi:MAG TPA: EAL domain-containing protein [Solirubrobacteraceae bacterium]|nr:EAL domain-containing protein [Solirubrobacteraceae bacterium]
MSVQDSQTQAPIRVVVADDDPAVVKVLAAGLEQAPGFELVGSGGDALEAVDIIRRHRPDIAVLDVRMPHGGGARVAADVADLLGEVALVALSGHDDPATVRRMLASGFVGYAVKGTAMAEFLALLESVAGRPSSPRGAGGPIPRQRLSRVLVAVAEPARLAALGDAVAADSALQLAGLAQGPFHAVTLAAREQPDVILVDPDLPGGGGMRTLSELRLAAPSARVVPLSGPDGPSPRATAAEVHALVRGDEAGPARPAFPAAPEGDGGEQIRSILDDRALETFFQPIADLATGRTVGLEALTRFPRWPQRGTEAFFAEAARFGLGFELELAAVARALEHLPQIAGERWLSLNVSPEHLLDSRMADLLASASPERLVLEITEHAPVPDYDELGRSLDALRAHGIRIAVDDAGAGFASLRHILLLRPDFIKLDVALCRDVGTDPARAAMARALVAFGGETHSVVVAEGIERRHDLETLQALGIRLGQGYHLGRPTALAAAAIRY